MSMWKLGSCFFYLQHKRLLINSQSVEQSELVLTSKVLHLHTAHISYLKVTAYNSIQQPLRWATEHRSDQTLRTKVGMHVVTLMSFHASSNMMRLKKVLCGAKPTNQIYVGILNAVSVITFQEENF